ncbi:MAG: carboxylating nicotinate-nucleotide diphosphorylase [Phycisphaerales bacterium]|nr:carboxylating nicotinate-nucleotide diphosphorylase [Phycisphaerales bacterium]
MNDALTNQVRRLAEMAREEDVGRGDITAGLLGGSADGGAGEFHLVGREAGVFAGRDVAPIVLDVFGGGIELAWTEAGRDGAQISEPPTVLATLTGSVQSILTVERTFLNFLQRTSGIATHTRRFVDAVAGTNAEILDTRKTTPGWRHIEKYAVSCGGGRNHRMGLHDAILIKDNHLAGYPPERIAVAVYEMLNHAGEINPPPTFVEVEADTLAQAEQLFDVIGIDVILLDNFPLEDLRRAVELRDARKLRDKVKLEASGGITLDTVRAVAETGVDYISAGAITHSAIVLDLAFDRIE